jgi:peptide/nickel transport system permease protein
MMLVALSGPWIMPYDPLGTNVMQRLQGPSLQHLMGTDGVGRDILSRLIAGARTTLLIGVTSSFIGVTIGTIIGVVSGYLSGKADTVIQRFMDMIMAFPSLILAIAIMAVLGSSVMNVILAIAFPMIPRTNRVARSVALATREFSFVEAARAIGASETRIIYRHIIPNVVASYLIVLTMDLGMAILAEASLSFLGLGIPAPQPSWGRDLFDAMSQVAFYPWLGIFPGLAIALTVFGANMFGDALRDRWDPRLRQV